MKKSLLLAGSLLLAQSSYAINPIDDFYGGAKTAAKKNVIIEDISSEYWTVDGKLSCNILGGIAPQYKAEIEHTNVRPCLS